ncbi:hypothetical protein [Salinisphaera sp. Q1T1-3]|uniref:hypothetical protein n=1 Tax=Salinisphaera sp. Q1T1-3 TaxID=2321229 RepID=UPI000E756D68|nr:hypothetical protein [Salinisphaera sp. Q1T1-3]RJS94796.1 hypothetical protein D3260_03240 [Salinisphaera sp. Q1T1-3]
MKIDWRQTGALALALVLGTLAGGTAAAADNQTVDASDVGAPAASGDDPSSDGPLPQPSSTDYGADNFHAPDDAQLKQYEQAHQAEQHGDQRPDTARSDNDTAPTAGTSDAPMPDDDLSETSAEDATPPTAG